MLMTQITEIFWHVAGDDEDPVMGLWRLENEARSGAVGHSAQTATAEGNVIALAHDPQ